MPTTQPNTRDRVTAQAAASTPQSPVSNTRGNTSEIGDTGLGATPCRDGDPFRGGGSRRTTVGGTRAPYDEAVT